MLTFFLFYIKTKADIIDSFEEYSPKFLEQDKQSTPKNKPAFDMVSPQATLKTNPSTPTAQKSLKKCKTYFKSSGIKGARQNGIIELKKNVFIKRCSLEITCGKAYIYFDRNTQEVVKIRALDNVEVKSIEPSRNLTLKAKGDKLIYYNGKQILELVGRPKKPAKMQRNQNVFSSKKIIYNIKTDTINSDNVEGVVGTDGDF